MIVKKKAKIGIFFNESAQPAKNSSQDKFASDRPGRSQNQRRNSGSNASGNNAQRGERSDRSGYNRPRRDSSQKPSTPRDNTAPREAVAPAISRENNPSNNQSRENNPRNSGPRNNNPRNNNQRESMDSVLKDAPKPVVREVPREARELRVIKPKTDDAKSDKKVINAFVKK